MHRRLAFTLTELLVVIAIVSVLLGLILAAVQKARDAAARIRCASSLRQLGLALHQYHDTNHIFPPGMRWQNGTDPYRYMSWMTQILPYIEQEQLLRITQKAYQQSSWPFNNPPHIGLNTVLNTFGCPSDSRVFDPQFAPRDMIEVALTSYLGVEGEDLYTQDGILFRDSQIRMEDVTDGTSQTLLVGERPPSADFQFGWWYAGAGQQRTGSTDMVLGVEEENVSPYLWAPCAPGRYVFGPGRIDDQCDMFHFWSLHSGGANFLFADASVRFLTYSAAPIMPALASRAGGEIFTVPD
jgi:prepilin-type N-terminal cleavage/methylation domain-containing protein/prepilin-type processing-associated H-X9-DG protein